VVAFTDVEERRAYEQALHDHDAILQMVAQPVLTTENGIIRYVNAAAGEVLGHEDASQLVGRVGYWAVHWKHPDGSHYPIEECPLWTLISRRPRDEIVVALRLTHRADRLGSVKRPKPQWPAEELPDQEPRRSELHQPARARCQNACGGARHAKTGDDVVTFPAAPHSPGDSAVTVRARPRRASSSASQPPLELPTRSAASIP
jgi:hypothetical protein